MSYTSKSVRRHANIQPRAILSMLIIFFSVMRHALYVSPAAVVVIGATFRRDFAMVTRRRP
jgi:hypothetical protein